jgi:hypothetical protein
MINELIKKYESRIKTIDNMVNSRLLIESKRRFIEIIQDLKELKDYKSA